MTGRREWRVARTATLVVAVVLALPALAEAAATPSAAGAAGGSLGGGKGKALAYWTPNRLEAAEPLPVVTLPGAPPGAARTAAVGTEAAAPAAAIQGTEIDAAESMVFPNSANGKVFGVFETHPILGQVEIEKYVCSGSVVASRGGDVVLTAGHCVIDRETGTVADKVIFVPGYRDCSDPYGAWEAFEYATTESWKKSVGQPLAKPNEGGDMALLLLHENEAGESVEDVVGSLGIGFDQNPEQTYAQYGYPAEQPYDGEALYRHEAPYAGRDDSHCGVIVKLWPCYEPEPIKIASDFTQGASGGPWTVGSTDPQVLSLTAYGYEKQPGYLYGPYFSDEAEAAYEMASEATSGPAPAPRISTTCQVRPRGTTATPTPSSSSGAAAAGSRPAPAPARPRQPTLRVKKIRRRADGSAIVVAKVGGAGLLRLAGGAVRADSLQAPAAGRYRLTVAPKRAAGRRLRRRGQATVRVRIAFRAAGETSRLVKRIHLRQRSLTRRITRHTAAPRRQT